MHKTQKKDEQNKNKNKTKKKKNKPQKTKKTSNADTIAYIGEKTGVAPKYWRRLKIS